MLHSLHVVAVKCWMDGSAVYKWKEENQGREAGLWMDAWMERQMDRCEDGRQEGPLWEGGQVERWMEGWLDNGWKEEGKKYR